MMSVTSAWMAGGSEPSPGTAPERKRTEEGAVETAEIDAAEVALRVAGAEERHSVLRRPGEPVEEALVARPVAGEVAGEVLGAASVEGADVEEPVQAEEGRADVRTGVRELPAGPAKIAEVGSGPRGTAGSRAG